MITVKEEFLRSDKTRRAVKAGGHAVITMWLGLKGYSSEHLTDGFIPDEDVDATVDALVDAATRRKALRALLECGRVGQDGTRGEGLLERVEHGYLLHDYLEHEESSDVARERRRQKAERQQRWRKSVKVRDTVDADPKAVDCHVDATVDAGCASTETSPSRVRVAACVSPPLPSPPLHEDPSLREGSSASQAPASPASEPVPHSESENRKSSPGKPSSKPVPLPGDWQPNASQAEALAIKHGVAIERIRAEVPEFRWYWLEGKGAGKRRSPRGWAQTFATRVDSQAQRGVLYAEPPARTSSVDRDAAHREAVRRQDEAEQARAQKRRAELTANAGATGATGAVGEPGAIVAGLATVLGTPKEDNIPW